MVFYHFLVNVGLLAIPIGGTIGVLVGIDYHRQVTGQAPLFVPEPGGGGGGNNTNATNPIIDNGIKQAQYCQKQNVVTPWSKGTQYTLNPNQWGWTEGTPGSLCMNVTSFNNATYPTNTTAPAFSVTWQYPVGPDTQPVHAFPYVQVDKTVMPISIDSVKHINLDMEWTYGLGKVAAESTDVAALTLNMVNTNVAIDMFLDGDKNKSTSNIDSKYEVMVWFGIFGSGAQPIGLKKGIVTTQTVNTTLFNLYAGQNGNNQTVLTWVASETTESFIGDLTPLVTRLAEMGAQNYTTFPIGSTYLGYLSLGTEAFSSGNVSVTFDMPKFSVDIRA